MVLCPIFLIHIIRMSHVQLLVSGFIVAKGIVNVEIPLSEGFSEVSGPVLWSCLCFRVTLIIKG